MDISNEYILMCDKAKEVQLLKVKSLSFITDNFIHREDKGHIYVNDSDDKWIWLPQQDQLQQLIVDRAILDSPEKKENYKGGWLLTYADVWRSRIWDFYSEDEAKLVLTEMSCEQFWLMLVMDVLYEKKYNFNNKVWEKI